MEKVLSGVGSMLYGMRFTMLFFYAGLVAIIFGILGKFLLETYKLMSALLFGDLEKIDLIIKVLELVDMTMVAQLVWVVALAGVSLDAWMFAINDVQPSFIRVEADEATYNLHIILRFELEQEIMAGTIDLKELPEIWNARFEEYLGIPVPNDTLGVLQDVHWSGGGIGYFPTYALGNVTSLQIWAKVLEALPDLDGQMAAGELGPLSDWLRDNLYSLGRKLTPKETLERLTGSDVIDPQPYLAYLRGKQTGV
jgi:Zn-dependent M32 family carboxypeptidase